MIIVSDTSPVSALLTIGEIGLLEKLFGEVVIPAEVLAELRRSFPKLPSFLQIKNVQNLAQVAIFTQFVDAGEAEAIQLAKELRADRLLIDDFKGRQLAAREGVKVIGVLGVLLLAKEKRIITAIRPLIDRLKRDADFYLSEDIVDAALRAVGE
jgi:uncharacterized protein